MKFSPNGCDVWNPNSYSHAGAYLHLDMNMHLPREERRIASDRGMAKRKAGDIAFKAFTGALGVISVYLVANFSINLYNGISWHNAQTKLQKEEIHDQESSGL
ncbi:hypothetical protein SUGI_0893430 [Cryptomeria japonica]|nr:hypothetical protein SUGI_0893430 [Cryptomeria japonica]